MPIEVSFGIIFFRQQIYGKPLFMINVYVSIPELLSQSHDQDQAVANAVKPVHLAVNQKHLHMNTSSKNDETSF